MGKFFNLPQSFLGLSIIMMFLLAGCVQQEHSTPKDRESSIPSDITKVVPTTDLYPPQLHSEEWNEPVPVPYPISTAGAEDSPFIIPNGDTLYFFFTPDVRIPVEQQILDGVTGLYCAKKINGSWSIPERIILQDPGKLALDGCECVLNNIMWFCSAREGYTGINWFTAEYKNGAWQNWHNADFNASYEVGELHISVNTTELYFHSNRSGGKGGLDLWVSHYQEGAWGEPINIETVNTADNEGWPFLSLGGTELWFTRTYQGSPAIFRSQKWNGTWQEPTLILSQFAGEPSVDNSGNIYFVHHFYNQSQMIEADIYVAYKK